jgi:hypothetical protein
LFQSQLSSLPLAIQSALSGTGLNLSAASGANQGYLGNLGMGSQLGGQQYNTLQDQINRAYQEFIRTQPLYNPLNGLMQQLAMGQSSMYYPMYTQGALGPMLGAAGSLLPMIMQMFGLGGYGGGGGSMPTMPGGLPVAVPTFP